MSGHDTSDVKDADGAAPPAVTVSDNTPQSRYEAHLDGKLAGFMDYTQNGETLTIPHTEVDPGFGGRGVGSALVRGALDDIRRAGLTVRPVCPFVAGWIDKHPDYSDLVAGR